ncbi:MAG: DUF423 domain-containing protein [Opitutia bacterium]|nr:DUF423 domain-containing protein [Opitutales bacterium]PHX68631.1 MAG: DUF423 domain-containing protein [Opitutae bacterium]
MSSRTVIAGLMGATAVALGAFGAHGLKLTLQQIPDAAGWWNTATQYLMIHAVAVGAIKSTRSAYLWMGGSLIFSATLYAMALGGPKWLGAITPIGGTLLIGGWLLLIFVKESRPE